jgi:hypothetical protein
MDPTKKDTNESKSFGKSIGEQWKNKKDKYGASILFNICIPLIFAIIYWLYQYKDTPEPASLIPGLLFAGVGILLASYIAVTRTADLVAKDCAKGSEKGPIGFYKKQYSK